MARHTESKCQQALVNWFAYAHRSLGVPDARLLFAIPNGGKRGAITGAILKKEGVRAGIPDMFLAVPRIVGDKTQGRFLNGMFIELKTWEGRPSAEQIRMLQLLRESGYEAVVARGFDQAMRAITMYLLGQEVVL